MRKWDETGLPWARINDFIYALGSSRSQGELIEVAIAEVGKLLPYSTSSGVFVDKHGLVAGNGLPTSSADDYRDHYQKLCEGISSRPDDAFEFSKIYCDEFYFDFARPHGLEFGLAPCEPIGALSLSVSRSLSGPAYGGRDEAIICILSAHLSNFYSIFEKAAGSTNPDEAEIRTSIPRLSKREAEVARLLCDRLSAREMASRLFLSVRTVETHVFNLYAKLGACTRNEAIAAIREACARSRRA